MAEYRITATADDTNINAIRKKMAEVAKIRGGEAGIQVEKVERNPSRADRLSRAESKLDDAKGILQDLKEEMENWRDSIPDNLQGGDKYSEIEECISALEDILSGTVEDADFGSVSFPGMM